VVEDSVINYHPRPLLNQEGSKMYRFHLIDDSQEGTIFASIYVLQGGGMKSLGKNRLSEQAAVNLLQIIQVTTRLV